MGRGVPKDLFISHTKANEVDRKTVDALVALILPARYTIWGYRDWDWYKRPPAWQVALASDEPGLAPSREVDQARLDTILSRARAVIFLYPSDSCLSEGMKKEISCIRQPRLPYLLEQAEQILLWCTFEGGPDKTSLVGTEEHRSDVQIALQKGAPDSRCIADVAVVLSTLLLKQRLDYISDLPGDVEDMISRLFGLPDQEISRASQLLERVRNYGTGTYEPLVQHVNELRDLLRRSRKVFAEHSWRYPGLKQANAKR